MNTITMEGAKKYYCIGFCLFLLLGFPLNVFSQTTPGQLVSHPATNEISYNWFSYVPSTAIKGKLNFILLTGFRGEISDDYDQAIATAESEARRRQNWAETYGFINLTPVIPRSATHLEIYTINLDRESLTGDPNDFLQRADLKVNLMIDQLKKILRDDGYLVHDKVFIEGHSVGGSFAQRYCLLHPERVQAIFAGGTGGFVTLPAAMYQGTSMNWPVGLNDFSALVGYNFDFELYKQVPQFIYMGENELDPMNSFFSPGNADLLTEEQKVFLNTAFGDIDPYRVQNQVYYMGQLGCNVQFKLYSGIGHWGPDYVPDILADFVTFFAKYKNPSGRANEAPTAEAGPTQTVNEDTLVTLNGSNSTDPDGTIVSYQWTQTGGSPAVTLWSATTAQPTFMAPTVCPGGAALTFQLTVADDGGLSASDTVIVNVCTMVQWPGTLCGGWCQTWMSWVHDGYFPWGYHDIYGWIYIFGTDPNNLWFYNQRNNDYWWTTADLWPYIYFYNEAGWFYNEPGTNWFVNLNTGQWVQK